MGKKREQEDAGASFGSFPVFSFLLLLVSQTRPGGGRVFRVFVGVTGAESNSLQKKKEKRKSFFRVVQSRICFCFLKRRKEKEEENMAAINVTNVVVLDNPAPFTNPLQFEIEYECL